jgi:hypothetical protein
VLSAPALARDVLLDRMHERTKEMESLRRLAELLRQAVTATGESAPKSKKELPRIRRVRRSDPPKSSSKSE